MVETTVLSTGPGADPDRDLEPGQTVGEYQIDRKLGQGGFGAVYKATHPLIGKVAAIKVLSREFSVNPEMVSRFVAEARAVNQIRHPNIIDIFSFGQMPDGRQFYVMEFLDGDPLDKYIEKQQRLALAEALPILRAIAKALDAAHAKGIAHRDLKAENVLLARTGEGELWPKLLDFGIAKLSGDDTLRHKTRTGAPMGTPVYMSPEQSRGRDVDYRTDLYAFGVLVYVMLTGVFPIDGEDYMTILMRQISDEPAPPSTHVAELPEAVDQTVAWLMRKEPAQRPPNAMTAVQALEGLVTAPAPVRAATTANLHAPTPLTDVVAAQRPPRRFAVWAIVGIAIAAGIGATFLLAQDRKQKVDPVPVVVPAIDAAPVVAIDAAPPPVDAPSKYVTLDIQGTPPNTRVKLGKDVVGIAPGPVTIERFTADSIVLVLEADGHKPARLTVTPGTLAYTATLKKAGRQTRPAKGSSDEATDDIDTFPPPN